MGKTPVTTKRHENITEGDRRGHVHYLGGANGFAGTHMTEFLWNFYLSILL